MCASIDDMTPKRPFCTAVLGIDGTGSENHSENGTGAAIVVLAGVRGVYELPPRVVALPSDSGERRSSIPRYPSRARYSTIVAAGGPRLFVLAADTEVDIRSLTADRIARIVLPPWPEPLEPRAEASFSSAQLAGRRST